MKGDGRIFEIKSPNAPTARLLVGLYIVGEDGLQTFCEMVRKEWTKGKVYTLPMPISQDVKAENAFSVYAIPENPFTPETG
mgnify:CR=1 FL=1